jgi:hypothetical protein
MHEERYGHMRPTLSEERRAIHRVLEAAGAPLGPREIAEQAGSPYGSVRQLLSEMVREGQVARPAYGKYALPAPMQAGARPSPTAGAELVRYPYVPAGGRVETEPDAYRAAPAEPGEELVRSRSEVYRLTGLRAELLRPFFVAGPAMEPEIRANTPALYLPMDRFEASGIYVLALDDVEVVRVVDLLGGGAFELSSLNTGLFPRPEMFLPVEGAGAAPGTYRSERTGRACCVRVIGRVVLYTKAT